MLVWLTYRFAVFSALCVLCGCYSTGRGLHSPLSALENSLVFAPSQYPEGDWSPETVGAEDVWLTAADGTRLHAWYLQHPQPRAVLLYAHGNAGNLSHRAQTVLELYQRQGVSVMIFDYRGYGRSEGVPDEAGILLDARAARDWLAQQEKISPRDIVMMGRSLGGSVAVDLAATEGARGLILVSTFTSLPDVGARSIPLLPVRSIMQYRLDSKSKIADYHGPLLQCHGDADRVIPYDIGRELFDSANEPKQFVPISGGSHNDPLPTEFHRALDAFLTGLPKTKREPQ